MMVAASSVPRQPRLQTRTFSTELLLDQQNMEWITAIGDVRHYWYPIHTSRAFVFTQTLGAALYLMLMRFFDRQYDVVFRMAETCVSDTELSGEERQIFLRLTLTLTLTLTLIEGETDLPTV